MTSMRTPWFMGRFSAVRAAILERVREARTSWAGRARAKRGRLREQRAFDALALRKGRRDVADFMETASCGVADVVGGVDFYVVVVEGGARRPVRLAVTGPDLVAVKEIRHPGNVVVAVEPQEPVELVATHIMAAIAARKGVHA